MGGGKDDSVTMSPEQRSIYRQLAPLFGKMTQAGMSGKPAWQTPDLPDTPNLSGTPMYDIPDARMMQPTKQWWEGISPEVKEGLYAPYEEAGRGMLEKMGFEGTAGSGRGGYSGAAGVAMGELASRAGRDVGLQAWQMTQPGAQMGWQAQLGANQLGYNQSISEQMMGYQSEMQGWQNQAQAMAFPFTSMPGMMGGTYQNPIVQQGQAGWGGALAGGAAGGMAGYGASGGNPYVAAGGAALGAYQGYYS